MHADSVSASDLPTTVYLKPSLTLSIPTNTIDLTLDPSSTPFSSDSISIEVGTNNILGYRLYVSTENNNTNLVHTVDNTKYIETLPSSGSTPDCSSTNGTNGCTESQFPANHWGYKLSTTSSNTNATFTTNYLPFVSGALISSSNSPVNSDTTTFTVGAKVDYTKDSGIYNTNLKFNALPTVETHYMQDFATDPTLASTLCLTGYPTLVTDSRDNKTYYIQRLKDGKCWMIQNLRLGEDLEPVTGSLTLTDQDTDISTTDAYNPESSFVLTNKVAKKMPGKYASDSSGGGYIYDGVAFYCMEAYGCYYNFYTATAGIRSEAEESVSPDSRVITTQDVDATTTICPKGWTLPTGGTHGQTHVSDWRLLVAGYGFGMGSDTATVMTRLLVSPQTATENFNGSSAPGFFLGGYISLDGEYRTGIIGEYWSRTVLSIARSHYLYLGNTATPHIYPAHQNSRADGRSVRCLLQES